MGGGAFVVPIVHDITIVNMNRDPDRDPARPASSR